MKKNKKLNKEMGQVALSPNWQNYNNREYSWLEFNRRVLELALDFRTPLLERLRFCNIFVSNLDEFYMKRVGGLKNQFELRMSIPSKDGQTPHQQLLKIRTLVIEQFKLLEENYQKNLIPSLEKEGVYFIKWRDLKKEEKAYLDKYFKEKVFPVLTPLAVDSGHPFPFISNLSKNFGISLQRPNDSEKLFARVKIPDALPQWISIPSDSERSYRFINLEEVIEHNLHHLFVGMKIKKVMLFRITRNADLSQDDDDVEDLMDYMAANLKERKFAPVVRLEVEQNPDSWMLEFLLDELELFPEDIYEMSSLVSHTDFSAVIDIDEPGLKYRPWRPITPHELLDEKTNICHVLKKRDILCHHPFESFGATVEKMITDAAVDPRVLAIKVTLYRSGSNSQIVAALIRAAEEGKQVACLIELKARFDEERNIYLAQKLENAGVHVAYGMVGLKTHSKMALVVRDDFDSITSYAHLGTGNYNGQTAKLYTDLSYFTSRREITSEVIQAFNFLTGISLGKEYDHLLVAPLNMKSKFISLIRREIQNKKAKKPARIIAKMNSLEDAQIIDALYDASKAGVEIDLVVRGFCCLKPGIEKLSENIRVISILGRFLEHSRIFYFAAGHSDPVKGDYYMGSADWMYRNLNARVEVICPIYGSDLKGKLWHLLESCLLDERQTWELRPDGRYQQRKVKNIKNAQGIHKNLMDYTKTLHHSSS